ncbi:MULTISPECIES: iron ABC transporter permease [Saccharopolyspora]|uniref:Iron ABC transporter permease n=1 Tax=Saccharopolyspora gregorii TaxID=33914 RepID=A0ABP6RUP8_9PSEU|nr:MULTISPECIES: iron ABC transporter permease [Saccharopolyspora]MCA1187931.1 iron ABC transporter permease [Saccharopolyspora sp. 6T]MCA1195401.1 iron ABC transporter permease [Saccharopolyspora sp. 6V]MCA1226391.1 iron ABC transporter permease [Saccharopolyspora sp. 6M]MCA1279141.1 iron ABC transporter permease [Saccharopolyspora sp. 7B]
MPPRPDTTRRGSPPRRLRAPLVVLLLCALLPVSTGLSTAFGAEPLPIGPVADALLSRITGGVPADLVHDTIVWNLRLPRALLAVVVGAGLALAGAAMQTLVRNPLADPYLLGVSSGAGVGATLVITTGLFAGAGIWALSAGALTGALCSALLVFGIAVAQGGLTPLRLVLIGTVLGSAFSSVASFLVFRSSDPAAAQSVLFWLLGSLAGAEWSQLALPAGVVAVAGVALFAGSGWLDALSTGPDTAAALGVPVRALRIALFVLLAVLVGVLVAVSGGIGFVGLVVPHIARLVVGARHRALLPVAALAGALFLLWVDVATRVLVRPTEIPLSVVSGLIGAPVFLVLLGRRRYAYGGAS